jgi:tetratricopeptide (TPR) repeat protein
VPENNARALLKQGDDAMMQRNWRDAEDAFQRAVDADPNLVEAHTKLSNALALQLHPGPITSAENRSLLARVLSEQQWAAELAPNNSQVLNQLARIQDAIVRSSKDPDERSKNGSLAVQNELRAVQLVPGDANLHFDLAEMEVFAVSRAVREAHSVTPNVGTNLRIHDDAIRQSLAFDHGATLDDAIAQLEKAVQIQPDNGFAMLLAAVGYTLRASLASSDTEAMRATELANQWEGRFRTQWGTNYSPEAERNIIGSLLSPQVSIASRGGMAGGVLGGVLSGIPSVAPPPPPPPDPRASSANGPLAVGARIAAANLIKKVEPIYPPLAKAARVQGPVEFTTIIDKTGHVEKLILVQGHPLLVSAAKDAILQWEYRPVLMNGYPVEVITDVTVNFTLGAVSPGDSAPSAGSVAEPN